MSPAQHRSDDEADSFRFAAARQPLASPAATPVAVLLALAVLALGVLAVRDALVEFGVLDGTAYVTEFAQQLDGLTAQSWMFWAGIGGVLLGLVFLYLALKRRRRTGVPLESEVAMFARTSDVARLASDTTTSLPGVLDANSSASRKKVTVNVQTTGHAGDDLRRRVSDAVSERLAPFTSPPKVTVRAHSSGSDQ